MGVGIDIHIYDYEALCNDIVELSVNSPIDRTPEFFIENILPKFGVVSNDKFITLWNEYYEEYNSGLELMHAVDLYFGIEDTYLEGYGYGKHANAYEVLEELEIEPIEAATMEGF